VEGGAEVSSLADHYRRWFQYEQDAHAKTLRSLEDAPVTAKSTAEFAKCLDLMAHVAAARWMWLFRLGGSTERPATIFPRNASLPDLKRQIEIMHGVWSGFLAQLSDADLERVIEYRTTEGEPYRSVVEDVLTQLYGHSLYHRGQVAILLRRIGAEPAVTDFIFWARERAAG
jgi:uncharacterized damage-inducible protein DinB